MTIRQITLMGSPVLSSRATKVTKDFMQSQEFQIIIQDMKETLGNLKGVGLAAPQIGESLQIFVVNILPDRAERENCTPLEYQFFINPEFIFVSEESLEDAEACFSIPGLMGAVKRAKSVRIKAIGLDNEEFELDASNFFARVLQHEMDHLDGKLYWLRINECQKFGFMSALPGAIDPKEAKPTLVSRTSC